MITTHLDVEPDPGGPPPAPPAVAPATPTPTAALSTVLPPDFPLTTLLSFLPDVRLKQRVEAAAAEALAVDVAADGGVALADARLADVRAAIKATEECFAYPCDLANQLHKRLTGLRADFCAAGKNALDTVGKRVIAETRRAAALAEDARRRAQAEADEQARAAAQRAAANAAAARAPEPVVEALKRRAETATAPPVPPAAVSTPRRSTVVANWKCRFKGTPDDANPNPTVPELTPEQQIQFRALCMAVANGRAPLAAVAIDWSYLNRRAGADKSTFDVPELEAFDEGGLRARRTR